MNETRCEKAEADRDNLREWTGLLADRVRELLAGKVRPSEELAERAIERFLRVEGGLEGGAFSKCEDGESGWAFWIEEEDTTSYLDADLKVEWYGTSWSSAAEDEDEDEDEVRGVG
jgi:hypothetical protein